MDREFWQILKRPFVQEHSKSNSLFAPSARYVVRYIRAKLILEGFNILLNYELMVIGHFVYSLQGHGVPCTIEHIIKPCAFLRAKR